MPADAQALVVAHEAGRAIGSAAELERRGEALATVGRLRVEVGQRLAIARAFLKDAPIMIFDEVTANLDTGTEREVLRAIHHVLQGRTTLMITHRLVGLDMANEILVLQSGKIRERGTHYDLLQAEGLYWKLW